MLGVRVNLECGLSGLKRNSEPEKYLSMLFGVSIRIEWMGNWNEFPYIVCINSKASPRPF